MADIDDAIGRGHRDMSNMLKLGETDLVAPPGDDAWALTPGGVAWLEEGELSDRRSSSRRASGPVTPGALVRPDDVAVPS